MIAISTILRDLYTKWNDFLVFALQVEAELIEKLDYLINENKGDDEYRQLFNTM